MSLTSSRAAPPRVKAEGQNTEAQNARKEGRGSDILAFWRSGFWRSVFGGPGGDLLSRVLGRSTIGAEGFHGRVRDGIGCLAPRHDHQVVGRQKARNQKVRRPEENVRRAVRSLHLLAFWPSGFWLLARVGELGACKDQSRTSD